MSNTHLRKLQDTLAGIEADIRRLQQRADQFRGVIAFYEQNAETLEPRVAPTKEMRNVLWDILNAAGEPMHFKVLHDQLVKRGVQVPGKEPVRNVGAHLSNDDRFTSLGSGMWGLASWGAIDPAAVSQPWELRILPSSESMPNDTIEAVDVDDDGDVADISSDAIDSKSIRSRAESIRREHRGDARWGSVLQQMNDEAVRLLGSVSVSTLDSLAGVHDQLANSIDTQALSKMVHNAERQLLG